MDYVRILYTYIVEDFMYSGYLLLTLSTGPFCRMLGNKKDAVLKLHHS